MAYNSELENRIDNYAFNLDRITKKKMFGGLGYLLNGNMCFGIHKDFLILRTSPEKAEELLKLNQVRVFDITGRPMKGWLMVEQHLFSNDRKLNEFLNIGRTYALTLPEK